MFLFYLTTTVIGPDIFYLYNPHYEADCYWQGGQNMCDRIPCLFWECFRIWCRAVSLYQLELRGRTND